jgi:copper(I)-binding protein
MATRRHHKTIRRVVAGALGAAFLSTSGAAPDVHVQDAWMRMPRHGFTSTVAFMTITSGSNAKVIGASSPLATKVVLQQMQRLGSEVRMTAVPAVVLPAGRPVKLQMGEGRFQLMVTHLKQPLKSGEVVPMRLCVQSQDSASTMSVPVDVRVVGTSGTGHDDEEDIH